MNLPKDMLTTRHLHTWIPIDPGTTDLVCSQPGCMHLTSAEAKDGPHPVCANNQRRRDMFAAAVLHALLMREQPESREEAGCDADALSWSMADAMLKADGVG